jgi:hypothetical protein
VPAANAIIEAEALAWLAANPAEPQTSVVTSLPDRSELRGASLASWTAWFVDAARAVVRWVPEDGVAIFYQTDVRNHEAWIDKAHLVLRAADAEAAALIFHKIVCRMPPGTANPQGGPSYSHLLCVARDARAPRTPQPDVLPDAGPASWPRGMGEAACRLACAYLRADTSTRRVVDPFCGHGSVLAVACAMGFDVLGVDLNRKCCRAARTAIARAVEAHDLFVRGADAFDRAEFFEAHERWEERWRVTAAGEERLYLQGLIQIAAAFHKLFVMRGPEAAERLLQKGLSKLEGREGLMGVDLLGFCAELRACSGLLASRDFDRARVPRFGRLRA